MHKLLNQHFNAKIELLSVNFQIHHFTKKKKNK